MEQACEHRINKNGTNDSRLAWMAAKLVSSKRETRYASAASCSAITADDWKRKSVYSQEGKFIIPAVTKDDYGYTHLEILSDFTNKPLEGELPDKKLSRLLVPSDFTKGDRSRAETMGFLHTTRRSLSQE